MILRAWLVNAAARLSAAGIDSAPLESQLLASHVLLKDRSWIIAHPEAEIDDLAAETVLQRREAREPLAYILGWREFYGRRFRVRPGVLIPRQETETLVEATLRRVRYGRVLDLGTGSGCIAITLKLENPDLEVWASDVSELAIEIARDNCMDLGCSVEFVRSDGFAELSDLRFEAIVSNPPYIADSELLMPEVARHEPHGALFSGPTGLEFYDRLAEEAPEHLVAGGMLLTEVGHTQAGTVSDLLRSHGWKGIEAVRDMSGIERVVVATVPD